MEATNRARTLLAVANDVGMSSEPRVALHCCARVVPYRHSLFNLQPAKEQKQSATMHSEFNPAGQRGQSDGLVRGLRAATWRDVAVRWMALR